MRGIISLHSLKRHFLLHRDPIAFARSLGVKIGANCRLIGATTGTFGSEPYLIEIGDHVTVTGGVRFITHDGGVWVFRQKYPDIDVVAPIIVGNNVFIGMNSILLPGVMIGDNCVIGAGSVVTKSIPSNIVAAGVPARPLRTLDEYWEKVKDRAVFVRSWDAASKREAFENIALEFNTQVE